MGIAERRERERGRRRREILDAAWNVAESGGWPLFSMERVAVAAELGRATIYGYFPSLDALVATMADEALRDLSDRMTHVQSLAEALDAPVRFSQARPAAFALMFAAAEAGSPLAGAQITRMREEARQRVGALRNIAARAGATLPDDDAAAEAFLAGIAMAGATVPELRDSTPLRRRWQEFCLSLEPPRAAGLSIPDEAPRVK